MKKRKTKLYVIPGMGESTRAKNYRELIRYARKVGFIVVPVNIKWSSQMDMSNFIAQADKKIPDSAINDYILGFSFGSYIAANLARKKDAKGYIFCSTSPYFKENLKNIPKDSRKYFGKKLFNSFKQYSFPKNVHNHAWFLVGQNDWKIAINLAKKQSSNWVGKSHLGLIKDAGHELSHPNYLKEVKRILKKL
jgi:hypothetical protein